MNEIYFEVPKTTSETAVNVINEGDLYYFYIMFFESEYSNSRMITIRSNCTKDGKEDITSLSCIMDEHHSNEFEFIFESQDKIKVNMNIFMDNICRIIRVSF